MVCEGCRGKVRKYYGSLFSNRIEAKWVVLGTFGECHLSVPREVPPGETYDVSLDYMNTSFRFLRGRLYVKDPEGREENLWTGNIYPKSSITVKEEAKADIEGKYMVKFDVKPFLLGSPVTECSKVVEVKKPVPKKVVVFANEIDWELCKDDLQECLGGKELVWTQSRSEYEKYNARIILGGPKAKVVGSEVQRICDEVEKCSGDNYCDLLCREEYTMIGIACASSGGRYNCRGGEYPSVIVFMGLNRCYTEHTVREFCERLKYFLDDPSGYHVIAYYRRISECES